MKRLIIITILCSSFLAVKAPEAHIFNIFRPKPTIQHPSKRLSAILWVESGSGTYNSKELGAVGVLQQHEIFVDDVNRILKKKKYSYDDRNDKAKAIEMFLIFQNHYNPEMNFEKMTRIQVSGPCGMKKKCSERYYLAVREKLYSDFYK
jgi:hypothetical protein